MVNTVIVQKDRYNLYVEELVILLHFVSHLLKSIAEYTTGWQIYKNIY